MANSICGEYALICIEDLNIKAMQKLWGRRISDYAFADFVKILCFCGSGLGTSFLMEMNVKKALDSLGISGVEVDHTTIDDIIPGAVDLFVCGADLLPNAQRAGKAIGINNMVSLDEMTEKLKEAFEL